MIQEYFDHLVKDYPHYRESSVLKRNIKHEELENLILTKYSRSFLTETIGKSVENRNIYRIKLGNGKRTILMWTQMHGDEPTATLSVLDILNYLEKNKEDDIVKEILDELTVFIIPMLNPDGAEYVTRFNSLGIDINRDAEKLESPEAKILYEQLTELKPEFAFNLHDQDIRWSVGKTNLPASISLLAPPPDYEKTVPVERLRAMKLIAQLYKYAQVYLEGKIAKYKDEHEPRSFGDTASKLGASTILIESGKEKESHSKENIRQIHFAILLTSLASIAYNNFEDYSQTTYDTIPVNGKLYFDLLLKNVIIKSRDNSYTVDLGINREQQYDAENENIYFAGIIDSIGDLSNTFGLQEIDLEEWEVLHPQVFINDTDENSINTEFLFNLLKNNFLFIYKNTNSDAVYDYPFNITNVKSINFKLAPGSNANFILQNKAGKKMWVLNGYLIMSEEDLLKVNNGIVKK